jgi:hypothetical protein
LTLLCWMVLWWRGGEGERERGYLASHILHLNLFGGNAMPSHLQVCTIMHFQLWLKFFKPKV